MKSVRLATWNIGSLYVDYQKNVSYLKNAIIQHPQDILCLQELPKNDHLINDIMQWGNFPHFKFLETSESHIQKEACMGVAIFSKHSFEVLETLKLPLPTVPISFNGNPEYWHNKYFTASLCDLQEQKIVLITGHGFPFHRYNLENPAGYDVVRPPFCVLDEWIEQLCTKYEKNTVCMAADFNITSPLPFMRFCQNYFFDAFDGDRTRPAGRKTDAVILPIGSKVLKKENFCLRDDDDQAVFDHHFVSAEFSIME